MKPFKPQRRDERRGSVRALLCTAVHPTQSISRGFLNAKDAKVYAKERRGSALRPLREPLRPLRLIRPFSRVAALPRCVHRVSAVQPAFGIATRPVRFVLML